MNDNYNMIINELKQNIYKIISLYKEEIEKNKDLTDELNEIRKELIDEVEKNKNIEKKYEVLKMAKSLSGEDVASQEAKIKLNKIIREVDNCIALVNK